MQCKQIQQCGLTLLELLVYLSIATLVLVIGVPFLRETLLQQRATAQMQQLVLAINTARSEAMTRADVITLCRSRDFLSCNGTWSDGYILFIDEKANGQVSHEAMILRVFQPLHASDKLSWSAFGSNNYLQMSPNGFTRSQNGTFYYCPANGDAHYARAVIVDQTGRARVSQDQDGDGIHENAKGDPLRCD